MMRLALALAALAVLPGCAPKPLYQWYGYDNRLVQYYRAPQTAEQFRVAMERQFPRLEQNNQRPAPGLYAEVGTLYLERGDRVTAAKYYAKERDAWPESRFVMEALLKNLQKMDERGREAEKK